eukprot:scaffold3496_cov213-Alexandrium_tamarense.AAC.7
MLLKYSEVCVWAVGVPVVQGRGGEAGPVLSHLDFGGESLPTIFGSTTTSAEGSKRFRCEGDSSPLYLCSASSREQHPSAINSSLNNTVLRRL